MEEKKEKNIEAAYYIPENYEGKFSLFYGFMSLRTFLEILILSSLPVILISTSSLSIKWKIMICIVIVSIIGTLCYIGINGDNISEFLVYYSRFKKERDILRYNNRLRVDKTYFNDTEASDNRLPRDIILEKIKGDYNFAKEKEKKNDKYEIKKYLKEDDLYFSEDIEVQKRLEIIKKERESSVLTKNDNIQIELKDFVIMDNDLVNDDKIKNMKITDKNPELLEEGDIVFEFTEENL